MFINVNSFCGWCWLSLLSAVIVELVGVFVFDLLSVFGFDMLDCLKFIVLHLLQFQKKYHLKTKTCI